MTPSSTRGKSRRWRFHPGGLHGPCWLRWFLALHTLLAPLTGPIELGSSHYGNAVYLLYLVAQFAFRPWSSETAFRVSSSEPLFLLNSCLTNFLPRLKLRGRPRRLWPAASCGFCILLSWVTCSFCILLSWALWWKQEVDNNPSGVVGEGREEGACSAWAQRYWNVNFWLLLSVHTDGSARGEEGR